jgi:4,5-dihydroxyphthalate decarboxylase
VFPSRAIRHNSIYMNAASGITELSDLRRRVVGVAEYQLTANVWIRGILADHYDVPVRAIR